MLDLKMPITGTAPASSWYGRQLGKTLNLMVNGHVAARVVVTAITPDSDDVSYTLTLANPEEEEVQGNKNLCGAVHPLYPDLLCTREVCVEYHRNGAVIWGSAVAMPSQKTNPVALMAVVDRTRAKQRRERPRSTTTPAHLAVLEALKNKPASDPEIYRRIVLFHGMDFMSPSGARSRRGELVEAGLIEDSGEKEKSLAGRNQTIWRVPPS